MMTVGFRGFSRVRRWRPVVRSVEVGGAATRAHIRVS